MAEIEKMNLESLDVVDERLERMHELFPEVFSESGIDFDKLRLELGDEVDDGDERYAFTWPGKRDAIRQSQTVSTATLRPCIEKSRGRSGEDGDFDTDNIYIEGDNLEVLKLLQRGYHGKIKIIYIDPPYNTGHDFVYHDSFDDTIENYKLQARLGAQSNVDTSGRYHANWCSMMYPRLKLARELLTDDGVVFVSIDDNEVTNLQKIGYEIFGDGNLLATLVITVKPEGRRYGSFAKTHEYMVVFAKDCSKVTLNEVPTKGASFTYSDGEGGFNLQGLRNRNVRAFNSSNRPNLRYPFFVNTLAKQSDGLFEVSVDNVPGWTEVWPSVIDGVESVWRWGRDKARIEIANLTATLGNDGHFRIFQKMRSLTQTPKTTWTNKLFQSNRGTKRVTELLGPGVFDFPKPVDLMEEIVRIGVSTDSVVLDLFSGSGSMAEAVMKANIERGGLRWIAVQLPEECPIESEARKAGYENLCEIGEERIRRAGKDIKTELEESNRQLKLSEDPKQLPDIGFRVFKLDGSGIRKPEPGVLLLDPVKLDRSELDIVFEMMLKWGLELTLPIEQEDIAGYPCYTVAYGELVCCLAPGLTIDALEAIAEFEPRRVFMLDSILNDSLKLNAVQIFKRVEERTGREVELRTV